MNLLAVDDQVNVVNSLAEGIDWKQIGIDRVFKATDVAHAKKIIKEHPVDIILCDIEMPVENGFDLVRWARTEGYDAECIFLTAHADFSYAKTAIRMGSFDYILKPARYTEIEAAVTRAMEKIGKARDLNRLAQMGKQVESRAKEEPGPQRDAAAGEQEEISGEEGKKRIAQVKRIIARNLDRDIRRDEIAEAVYLNPNYLSRLFSKVEGMPLKEYIIQEKMRTARDLIRTTRLSISIIAARVGYSGFSHFSQTYRQYFGVSPSEERKDGADD